MKKERHFIYRTKASHCKNCGFRKKCTDSTQGRAVIRHIHEASLEKAKEHLKTAESKATIAERSKIIECVFGSEKKDLGLKKAKFRGLTNVSVQSLLTAASHNLKKLVKYAKGPRQRLKAAIKSLILPLVREKAMRVGQILQETEPAAAASYVKERLFSVFRRIFLFDFA